MDGSNENEALGSLALMFRGADEPDWLPNLLALHARDQLASKLMATEDWHEILKLANELRSVSLSRINAKSRSHAGPRRPTDLEKKAGIDPVKAHASVLYISALLKCPKSDARDLFIRMKRPDLNPPPSAGEAKIAQAERGREAVATKLKNATDTPARPIKAMIKALNELGGAGIIKLWGNHISAARKH